MIPAMRSEGEKGRMRWWEWVMVVTFLGLLILYAPPFAGEDPRPAPGERLVLGSLMLVAGIIQLVTYAQAKVPDRFFSPGVIMLILLRRAVPSPDWFQYVIVVTPVLGLVLSQPFVWKVARDGEASRKLLRLARDEALRLKLAPHFLFNALNTVKAQLASDPQAAAGTVDRLAALLRQVLDGSARLTVPLREELSFVESYRGIERLRLGDRLKVKLEVPEALESVEVPPLSLQALVENAVKHGVAPREEGGEIRIFASMEWFGARATLRVGVENPLAEGPEPGTGLGLEALRARLRKPDDLHTESRCGRFLAQFIWYTDGAKAGA